MLRTNSKQARENIRTYIIEHFDPCGYDLDTTPETFPEIAAAILDTFRSEKPYSDKYIYRYGLSEQAVFTEWCAGLPSIIDTCYYYNRSAVDDLAAILEESDTEKARYNERDAEKLLTYLIYRELLKGAASK